MSAASPAPGRTRHRSLQYRLSAYISCAVVLIAGSAAAFTFVWSWHDAHQAQDKQLRQTAYLISRMQTGPVTLAGRQKIRGIRLEERLVARFLDADGADGAGPDGASAPFFPAALPDGLQTVRIADDSWRVFVLTDAEGVRLAVAQQTRLRDELAVRSAGRALLPFGVLALVLLLLVHWLIRQLFQPLRTLAVETRERGNSDLRQLDAADVPLEAQPLVAEINRLLARVDSAMQAQRRFLADAAHELRSPLTAMSLQAERLAAADMPDEARRRLRALADGLQRTRLMLDQLLALARTQQGDAAPGAGLATGSGGAVAGASLQQAVHTVIEELYPLAEQRGIDLGVVSAADADAMVALDALALHMLVKNLVDNAIRYTPPGGRVDVALVLDGGADLTAAGAASAAPLVALVVDDSGPGIPVHERARVFAPFYRMLGNGDVDGSGLGLAIVQAVADRAGASVTLTDAPAPPGGLRVTVRFAPAPVPIPVP